MSKNKAGDFLVLAGNRQQALQYLEENGFSRTSNHIISSPADLLGKPSKTEIRLIGTYAMREDWRKIQRLLIVRRNLKFSE